LFTAYSKLHFLFCVSLVSKINDMPEIYALLKKYYGYDTFRPLQEDIIRSIIAKEDSLVLMPTGGGKSICFQIPALAMEGTAIVVSPLIALMKDQVEGLQANGIPAAMLNSVMGEAERQQVKLRCTQGEVKLLYISPEGLMSELEWLLPRMDISMVAIDEAHCVSQWGHDFRPEYTQLSIIKERYPSIPIVALTATADKVTRQDIMHQLNLTDPKVFISSFDRPNLSLTVRRGFTKKDKVAAISRFIRTRAGESGIIYCTKRTDTTELAETLNAFGIRAVAYHAGMSPQLREQSQNDFIRDQVDVVCATIAFGMGIDKSNVRWVIHYNTPGSLENYYQEIGRAGRDGMPADTMLFYSLGDLIIRRRFAEESGQIGINMEKLDNMQRYSESDICRRRILLSYFGEIAESDCGNCDVCKNPPERFDGSVLVQKAISAIVRTEEHIGLQMLIDILRASARAELIDKGYHKLKTYGAGRDLSYKLWKEYLYQMIQLGYIEIDYASSNVLRVTSLGRKVLFGETIAMLAVYKEEEYVEPKARKGRSKQFKAQPIRPKEASSIDETLFDSLKQLRKQIADKERIPAFVVFSDAALHDMVVKKPVTIEQFAGVSGVGQVKQDKYGKVFTALIKFVLTNK